MTFPEHVNCNVRLFADDCLLFRNVNNQSDSELLQNGLTNLENWEKTWQMQFKPEKCLYVIHISKKKNPLNIISYYITIYYNQLIIVNI